MMNHLTDMKIAWDNLVCVHEYLDPEAPGQIAPPVPSQRPGSLYSEKCLLGRLKSFKIFHLVQNDSTKEYFRRVKVHFILYLIWFPVTHTKSEEQS